jgi:hypothetical protein
MIQHSAPTLESVSLERGGLHMATIQPKGEQLRQAIKWISEERQEDENRPIPQLIEKAALRFNLSPKDEEFLRSFYKQGG